MSRKDQLETKQILVKTLVDLLDKKPFSKITVNELCEKSGIVRSTFYSHFKDKYDLLSYCFNITSREWDLLMETHSPKDCFMVMLSSCQENEKILYNIFESGPNEEVPKMFYQFFSRYITQYLEEKISNGVLLPGPVETVTSFYVSGLVGMVLQWIKSGYKLSKETLASCQYRLMENILQ